MVDSVPPKEAKQTKKSMKKQAVVGLKNVSDKWHRDAKVQFGDLLNYYNITSEISRGAYGVVYEGFIIDPATQLPTEKRVAVKTFFLTTYPQLVYLELCMLKLLRGKPHIIQMIDFMVTNFQFYIIMDFYKNTSFEVSPYLSLCVLITNIEIYVQCFDEGN